MTQARDSDREKMVVALSSVVAAIRLTSMKLVVGLLTGSLGILAEAAHSGLDLVAALLTFFAVHFASRPADAGHHYGHGKVENVSAFLEAGLLMLTAIWISYEAIRRLLSHRHPCRNHDLGLSCHVRLYCCRCDPFARALAGRSPER